MRLLDDRHQAVSHRLAESNLLEALHLLRGVEDTHHQLFAVHAPGGRDAKVHQPRPFDLGGETAVLRLAPLGDVHAGEVLVNVQDRDAGLPLITLGRLQNAVDAVTHDHGIAGGLHVDVGRPQIQRVPNQFLRLPITLVVNNPGHLAVGADAVARGHLADEADGDLFFLILHPGDFEAGVLANPTTDVRLGENLQRRWHLLVSL